MEFSSIYPHISFYGDDTKSESRLLFRLMLNLYLNDNRQNNGGSWEDGVARLQAVLWGAPSSVVDTRGKPRLHNRCHVQLRAQTKWDWGKRDGEKTGGHFDSFTVSVRARWTGGAEQQRQKTNTERKNTEAQTGIYPWWGSVNLARQLCRLDFRCH